MVVIKTLVLLMSAWLVSSQRPSFAGSRPIGYPELINRTTTPGLVDKFGEGTTERLPIQAQGDKDLVDRLSKLPIDKQPFWFINWQAIEAAKDKPQTYPQKPNPFLEGNSQSFSTAGANNNAFANANSNSAFASTGNQAPSTQSGLKNGNSEANNRFGSQNSGVATDYMNTAVNDQPQPETQVDKELGDPLNKGNVATSNTEKKISGKKVEKDDQFEDIEVKKYGKYLKV